MTFEQAARAWHAQHEGGWKNPKHGRQVLASLDRPTPFLEIGNLPVDEIDTGLVLKCIEPIWADQDRDRMSRVRGRIESVFDWAPSVTIASGDNPARWKGHLAEVLPAPGKIAKPMHHAALPYTQIAEFVADLRTREGVAARALEFPILTAARSGEVIGARWSEIDLDAATWIVPQGRMKGGRAAPRAVVRSRSRDCCATLPTRGWQRVRIPGAAFRRRRLANMAMGAELKRMRRNEVTVHGFRSTFRDWAAKSTSFPNHVIEMALAHAIGNAVEAAYRRGDLVVKRTQLMQAWAAYCAKPAANGETVVPLRGRK